MKTFIPLLLFLILTSCGFLDQQAKIRFDNHKKKIMVLSENFGITYIYIREIPATTQADTAFVSIDFKKPVKEFDLRNNKTGSFSGQPIETILNKRNLEYNIILKGKSDGIGIDRLIHFESRDAKTNKIFLSNF